MAKRILVPVDRTTPVSDAVVTLVADSARASGAIVRLVHVAAAPDNVVGTDGRLVAYADQELTRLCAEHSEFLRVIADRLFTGVTTDCVVRFGEPVSEILDEAQAFAADLLVVGTKTRSSLSRALLGSVAEALVRRAMTTVVLVCPAG